MNNTSIDQYNRINQTQFPVVLQLSLYQEEVYAKHEPVQRTLFLELASDIAGSKPRLHLHFYGIQQLQIKELTSPFHLTLLEIYDLRDHQWEHINYKVLETEDLQLSFFCERFEATVK